MDARERLIAGTYVQHAHSTNRPCCVRWAGKSASVNLPGKCASCRKLIPGLNACSCWKSFVFIESTVSMDTGRNRQ